MKRLFAMLLACILVLSLAACGGKPASTSAVSDTAEPVSSESAAVQPEEEPEDASAPEAQGPADSAEAITVTWMEDLMADTLNANALKPDNSQNVLYRELEKHTGIHIDFRYENTDNYSEKFSLMLAGQDYPDIASASPDQCSSSGDMAYEEDVIIRLNEYEDILPNYMAAINATESGWRNAITDSGNLLCFAQIYNRLQPDFGGYQIRQNWLDDLGLQMPQTIDDWHEMLVAFKNEKTGGAAPMDLANTGLPDKNWFGAAYGMNVTGARQSERFFIQKDGTVVCCVIEPSFRDYLETMSSWYAEGLINPDFISVTGFPGRGFGPEDARLGAGESGAFPAIYSMSGSYFADQGMAEEGTYAAMAPQPTLERGVPNKIGAHGELASTVITDSGQVIFATSDYIDEILPMMDYLYSDEGSLLRNYGVEGETFHYDEDGKPHCDDIIAHNPDKLDFAKARELYLRHPGFIFDLDAEEDTVSDPYCLTYYDVWNDLGEWNIDGNITYSAEEGAERTGLMADIQTYVSEFAAKTIMGQIELNDDSWNTYLETMDSMNIGRATEIVQAAYDRFLAR